MVGTLDFRVRKNNTLFSPLLNAKAASPLSEGGMPPLPVPKSQLAHFPLIFGREKKGKCRVEEGAK